MKKTKYAALFGGLAISSLCLAGPPERHDPAFRNATKETAIEFVAKYYAHMDRGMSRRHLESYWTEDKIEQLDKLTVSIAERTGKELVHESQRLMDLEHMESRCEDIDLVKAKAYGSPSRKAKLEYVVNNHCESWRGSFSRTINLRFSSDQKHWLIDEIEDGEKQ